jgi:hypothetical protein
MALPRFASLTVWAVVACAAVSPSWAQTHAAAQGSAATAPASSSAPAGSSSGDSPAAADGAQPFGPGLTVVLECDKPWVYGYVAQGVHDDRPAFPDPFVKVGRLPVSIELPPGTYTVLVEGESIPTATRVVRVDRTPVRIQVKGGSQGMRDAGSLLTALGGLALAAGIVVEVSGTRNQDSSTKQKIALPLIVGGAVGFAGGLTMFLVARSSISDDGPVPLGQTGQARHAFRGVVMGGVF